ncbi:MAG TPA: hypothetical protein DDW88_00555 [Treponema sp.]|nr:hypothetical protein [Treponema sp.]
MNKRYRVFIFCCFVLMLFLSCTFDFGNLPPYCISSPHIILNNEDVFDSSCGLFFNLKNTDAKTIAKINLVFSAYESSNKKPITTKYLNEMSVPVFLPHGESLEVFIDLEPFIFKIPDSDCIVDFFCIKEVVFSNGDVWKDIFYSYAYSLE